MAEIQAAIVAINQARELSIRKLRVNTDSEVLFLAATEYIKLWKRNNWRSLYDSTRHIKDRHSFEALDTAMQAQIDIKFKHVQGHSGNVSNNAADRLARAGAELHRQ